MRYNGFSGGTYAGRSLTAAGDRCINLYPESIKSADPENPFSLLGTPGTKVFKTVPTGPIQKLYTEPSSNRVFAIANQTFYEIFDDVNITPKSYGVVGTGYYTFASNSQQIMFTCAGSGTGYIFTLATNALTRITSPGYLSASQVTMIDNYFITLVPNTREFQISALLDGTQWDALDVALAEGGSDNIIGMLADHRELWLMGSRRAEIFTDTGAALFPFERINSVYIEQGLLAPESFVQLDSTIFWLGQNEHGWARVFMNNGYSPTGVSTRSVEYFLNMYAKNGGIKDAKAYGYQDEDGHSFYVLVLPSATSELSSTGGVQNGVVDGACWVYDISENQWHERRGQNQSTGKFGKPLGMYHTFGFGKHLVGGGDSTGNIYELSTEIYQDNSKPIKRIRRAPHITDELKLIKHKKLRLNAQVGSATVDDENNVVTMRASNDGGMTWSNEYQKSLGAPGDYLNTIEWRALGRSRRRVYELSTTVNGPVCWVDAYLELEQGTK